MTYSDKELKTLAEIAYLDLGDRLSYEQRKAGQDSIPIVDLLTSQELEKLNLDEQMKSWKLSMVSVNNRGTGFYGCVIETSENEAAVSFRGSEDMLNINNANDWINNLSSINNMATAQQKATEKFLDDPKFREAIKNKNLLMVGHSLGGNLAEHATIVSKNHGIAEQIIQCASLDGQGFSDKYFEKNKKNITAMNDQLGKNWTHYKVSFVGDLLSAPTENVKWVCFKPKTDDISRHYLNNWIFDPDDEESFEKGWPQKYRLSIGSRSFDQDLNTAENSDRVIDQISAKRDTVAFNLFFSGLLVIAESVKSTIQASDKIIDSATRWTVNTGRKVGLNFNYDIVPDSFYLDISAYRSISNTYANLPSQLNNLASELRTSAPVPSFYGSSILDSVVQSLVWEIVNTISVINGIYTAAAESASLLDQAAATVRGSVNYVNITANAMANVEEEAKKMVESWISQNGGLMA